MTDTTQVHTLDTRELEPCEPMEQTFEALEQLPKGHCLKVLLRSEPHPLFPMLEKRGFSWRMQTGEYLAVELWIWHQGNKQAASLVPDQDGKH